MSDPLSELVEEVVEHLQEAVYTEAYNVWAIEHEMDEEDSRKYWDKVEIALFTLVHGVIETLTPVDPNTNIRDVYM